MSATADSAADRAGWVMCTTVDELVDVVGTPIPRVAGKIRTTLHDVDRQWLAASPLCLMATFDPAGHLDVSPKGDPPGFALPLDERTIVLPDRPGNRRVDGLRNLMADPRVGLLFLVPGRGDALRINGTAVVVRDAPFLDQLVVAGHRPGLAVVVDVAEVFAHCSKAFLRSKVWEPQTWRPDAAPSRVEISHAVERPDETLESLVDYYGAGYAADLYG